MTETFPIPFGRYQLLERLAVGGMAELFLAQERGGLRSARIPVVIKRLLPHMAGQSHFKVMFLDEARLTKRLKHPNIAQTYDFGRHGEQLFIAMEFVDGIDALALLRECAHRKVRLPPEIAVYTAYEVLAALDFAHNQTDEKGEPLGVVHRDISPSNVLLSRSGEIKLVDFGIARAAQRNHHTKDGTLKGKYGYMSPEQVIDDVVDARSDLFSVGIVLAELLTGRRLFAAPNELDVLLMVRDAKLDRLERYGKHIGVDLARILHRSLRKSRDERFATAAEFREALGEWLHLHHYTTGEHEISEVVESFYIDAWERKRGVIPGDLWDQVRAQMATEEPEAATDAPAAADAPAALEGETPHLHSVPSPDASASGDSMPVVLMEDMESAPVDTRAVSGTIQLPNDGVVVAGDWGETERMDGMVARIPMHEPTTVELTDMTGQGELAETVAEFTPQPAAQTDTSAAPAPVDADEPASMPTRQENAATYSSIDEAVDALAANDDGQTAHEDQPAADEAATHASAEPDPDLGAPDDEGDFADSPPIGVLYRLAVSRATGLLAVGVGGIRKEIYFREGIPEYVSSNVTNELFGEYLVQESVLSSGELSMALAMMPRYRNRLGDTLVGLNLLTPLEVLRFLTRQVRKKLVDVCTWGRGRFAWYAGRENTREAFPLDLNAFEVLGAGALETPDEVISDWLEKLGEIRPRLVDRGRVRPEVFQLGILMRDVCRTLDGSRTLDELRADFRERDQHERFVRVLFLLIQTDLCLLS
ncbi:serine/threonine protein kinase [Haliangium ochraceum]|uniref:Serine/threonine protein kinase n=1 Tax=Haliangium ochraceum (strain DSM 14365 / JCM 11303 / SMP-2) TaxID=502025 RepID=D0LIK6_HALO1|nr:serine/threonine-protein kinase [Haliangium ochraceum]ACY18362.1 serine/threonine protein kinase [Haliangium ochraceum DSM 14365]